MRTYKELSKDHLKSGCPRRMKNNIKAVRKSVKRDPKRPMKKIVRDFEMDPKPMRKIEKLISSFLPRNYRSVSILLSFNNKWQLVFFGIFWNMARIRWNGFFRRKIFTVEPKFNPQSEKVLAAHSEDVPEELLIVYRRQKPASAMVWANDPPCIL